MDNSINKNLIDLNKEVLTNLWELSCKTTMEDTESFLILGSSTSPDYTIRINNSISLSINGNSISHDYMITLIFSDLIRYKSFNIDLKEFEQLLDLWELGLNRTAKLEKEKKVNNGLVELKKLIAQFEKA